MEEKKQYDLYLLRNILFQVEGAKEIDCGKIGLELGYSESVVRELVEELLANKRIRQGWTIEGGQAKLKYRGASVCAALMEDFAVIDPQKGDCIEAESIVFLEHEIAKLILKKK